MLAMLAHCYQEVKALIVEREREREREREIVAMLLGHQSLLPNG